MTSSSKGFIFDMNGTMIDDMGFHINAWHAIVNQLGANLTLQQMKEECYGKNGEILERIFPGRFSDEEKDRMEMEKETAYQDVYRPHMKLIPGLAEFLKTAAGVNIRMGIGSAAIMFNVNFIIDGLGVRHYFKSIVSANEVKLSKPDPETFLKCAEEMDVAPSRCIVFEDAPKGVETAANAGMKAVVLTTMHTPDEFGDYDNIIAFVKDYTDPKLAALLR